MTDTEKINRTIYEWMHPEACWHELAPDRWVYKPGRFFFSSPVYNPDCNKCIKCGRIVEAYLAEDRTVKASQYVADYTESLDQSFRVQAKAIQTFGVQTYGQALIDQLRDEFQIHPKDNFQMLAVIFATANALTRARAIASLIKDSGECASTGANELDGREAQVREETR